MNRRIKRCGSFLLGLVLATSLITMPVKAQRGNAKVPAGIAKNEIEKQVDEYVEKYIGNQVAGATVVVVNDHKVVMNKAYGSSDVEHKTAISTKDTAFELGTLTKMYTYTAIMQQVEQGKIDLSEDIFTYLPEEFAKKLKKHLVSDAPIKVRNLIENTAGFEEIGVDTTVSDPKYLDGTLKEALERVMPEQIYAPGEVMTGASYSSALLGYLVECVTGKEFSQYVEEEILAPIGAKDSTMVPDPSKRKALYDKKAVAYGEGTDGKFKEVDHMYSNLYPNSGLVSTSEDVEKFLLSYLPEEGEDGTLLKADTMKEMFKKTYSINDNAKGQCVGFYEYPSDTVKAYYHDGSSNGYSSMMTIVPEEGFGVAVLTNSARSSEFMYGVTELLLEDGSKKAEASVKKNVQMPEIDDFVETSFVGAKRAYNNVMKIAGYFGNCTTFKKGKNENTLVLDKSEYVQVSPYVFQYVESLEKDKNTVLQQTIAKYIYFGHDETGKITKWSYGGSGATEFVATKDKSTQSYLTLGIFVVIVGGLLCGILCSTSVLLSVLNFVQKKKMRGTPKTAFRISILFFAGLEYSVVTELMKILGNNLVASKELIWHSVANYGITAVLVVSFGYFLYCGNKETIKPVRAVLYGVIYAFMALFIALMVIWRFFTII